MPADVHGLEASQIENTSQTGHEATEDIDPDEVRGHRHAGQARPFQITSHGEGPPAEYGAGENNVRDDRAHRRDNNQRGEAENHVSTAKGVGERVRDRWN